MSVSTLTQLGLTGLAGLYQNKGISINKKMTSTLGNSTGAGNYSSSSLTTDTILGIFTGSSSSPGITKLAYDYHLLEAIDEPTYRQLISLGATTLPALTGSRADALTDTSANWKEKWSFGAYRFISEQANAELNIGTGSYKDFLSMFMIYHSFMTQKNEIINSFVSAKTHLDGAYSNLNDLVTGDIAGVSIATVFFGQDLVALGKSINLAYIDKFGTPSTLLATLKDHNALSRDTLLALIYTGLTTSEIDSISTRAIEATVEQEKLILNAFKLVTGNELTGVLVPLNCKTAGLESLADLINLKKLFPKSFTTLTVPEYNAGNLPTNSKVYHLIFQGSSGVNPVLSQNGDILKLFLPADLAISCASFSIAMQQIKNIKTIEIEKLAAIVGNLELTSDLSLIGARSPLDRTTIDPFLSSIALGSGPNGTYRMSDFLGSVSGVGYDFSPLVGLVKNVTTNELVTAATSLRNLLTTATPVSPEVYSYTPTVLAQIANLINEINSMLATISQSTLSQKLNQLYSSYFTTTNTITDLRDKVVEEMGIDLSEKVSSNYDIESFMINTVTTYCAETLDTKTAQVIEGFMDLTTVTGQSIIAAMREGRNRDRLALIGAETDSEVPKIKPKDNATFITLVGTTNDAANAGAGFGPAGQLPGVVTLVVDPSKEIDAVPIIIPKVDGKTQTPGSLVSSEYDKLVPPNLDIFNIADSITGPILTPAEAIEEVIICNCDCWDLIT